MRSFQNMMDMVNSVELAAFGMEVVFIFFAAVGLVFTTGWLIWAVLV